MSAAPETNLRRFCVGAFLCFLVAFAAIWVYVIKNPMAYNEMAYPIWLTRMQALQNHQGGKLAILGDSRPMADLMPARLGPDVINLALPGAVPIECFYTAQALANSASPPKAVIISFTPSNFIDEESFWDMAAGFNFLNAGQIDEVRTHSREFHDDYLFGAKSPGDIDAKFKIYLYSIHFPTYRFPALYNTVLHSNRKSNQEMYDFVIANRGRGHVGLADGTTDPDTDSRLKAFQPAKLLDFYFDQTLSMLQSKNISVYFLEMPHNATSSPLYFPGLKEEFAEYLKRYAARYPNFHVLDDPLPLYPPEDFGDPDHLNEKGAVKWTDHVAEELNENHVEGGPYGTNAPQTTESSR